MTLPEKVQSFEEMMTNLISRKRGSSSADQASKGQGTGEETGTGQGTTDEPGTGQGAAGEPTISQGMTADPQDPEAPYNQDDPEGADNINLPEPPKEQQKVTGGNQLDSDGVSNDDLKFIQ